MTKPEEIFTVALPLLENQLPIGVEILNWIVLPTHTVVLPVMVPTDGCPCTVKFMVTTLLHPFEFGPTLYVIAVVPLEMPVTTPVELIVAVPVLELLHVPPPVKLASLVVDPWQTEVSPMILVIEGNEFTPMLKLALLLQPFIPVTV